MKWLIWKEFRLNWLILAIAALFLIAPYIVAGCGAVLGESADKISAMLQGGWMVNLLSSTVFLALLGGQSFACERADRSVEFLTYQPISRVRNLLSKLVWPAVALVVIFGLNSVPLLAAAVARFERVTIAQTTQTLVAFTPYFAAALCAFAIAWSISAWQNSPTFAVVSGIAVPIAVLWVTMTVDWRFGFQMDNFQRLLVFLAIYLSLTLVGFAVGTWHYLRRVEP